MKWVFTLTALLLFVESINLYHLIYKGKPRVVQVLCDHEKDEENSCEPRIEIPEIDKTAHHYNSLKPAHILSRKTMAYNKTVAIYLSGFIANLYQPPELCHTFIV
jgi:hypothetical protein